MKFSSALKQGMSQSKLSVVSWEHSNTAPGFTYIFVPLLTVRMTPSANDQKVDVSDSGMMLFVSECLVNDLDRLWVPVISVKSICLRDWLISITGAVSFGFNKSLEADAPLLDQLPEVWIGVQSMRRLWLLLLLFSYPRLIDHWNPGLLKGHGRAELGLVRCLGQADYSRASLLDRMSRSGNTRAWLFRHLRRVSGLLRRLGRAVIFC
jgi:hypothetical protein